jgi:hypothetical protein
MFPVEVVAVGSIVGNAIAFWLLVRWQRDRECLAAKNAILGSALVGRNRQLVALEQAAERAQAQLAAFDTSPGPAMTAPPERPAPGADTSRSSAGEGIASKPQPLPGANGLPGAGSDAPSPAGTSSPAGAAAAAVPPSAPDPTLPVERDPAGGDTFDREESRA